MRTRATIGAVIWAVWSVLTVPNFHHDAWAYALLLLAAWVLIPLALELETDSSDDNSTIVRWRVIAHAQMPAAALLTLAYQWPSGGAAALVALPWFGFTVGIALLGWRRIWWRRVTSVAAACGAVGLMFAGVGGAWVLADRIGFRPLGFPSPIVLLTAIHFHYAGLILPILAGHVLREFPRSLFAVTSGVGVLLGVPAVAVGITATQLGAGPGFETMAACLLATATGMIAALHVVLALQSRRPTLARWGWAIAGCSSIGAMSLAVMYAMRSYLPPIPWLDLPWMRALHGTANALGFAACGILAWSVAKKGAG